MAAEVLTAEPGGITVSTPSDDNSMRQDAVTLFPSRRKWGIMIAGCVVLAVAPFVGSVGDVAAAMIAAFFAFGALVGAIMLLPGAASLRIDRDGFRITHFFRQRAFRWNEVSDLGVIDLGQYGGKVVSFKSGKQRLGLWKKLNAALSGGRDECLPDTYGMEAESLLQLMNSWRNSTGH